MTKSVFNTKANDVVLPDGTVCVAGAVTELSDACVERMKDKKGKPLPVVKAWMDGNVLVDPASVKKDNKEEAKAEADTAKANK